MGTRTLCGLRLRSLRPLAVSATPSAQRRLCPPAVRYGTAGNRFAPFATAGGRTARRDASAQLRLMGFSTLLLTYTVLIIYEKSSLYPSHHAQSQGSSLQNLSGLQSPSSRQPIDALDSSGPNAPFAPCAAGLPLAHAGVQSQHPAHPATVYWLLICCYGGLFSSCQEIPERALRMV